MRRVENTQSPYQTRVRQRAGGGGGRTWPRWTSGECSEVNEWMDECVQREFNGIFFRNEEQESPQESCWRPRWPAPGHHILQPGPRRRSLPVGTRGPGAGGAHLYLRRETCMVSQQFLGASRTSGPWFVVAPQSQRARQGQTCVGVRVKHAHTVSPPTICSPRHRPSAPPAPQGDWEQGSRRTL